MMHTEKSYCPWCGAPLCRKPGDGRERLYCDRENRFLYENPVPAATGLVQDERGYILLVLRNREPGRNRWALPGGFVEHGESPAEAAAREIREETGLRASGPSLIDVIYQESIYYGTSLLIIGYHFARYEGETRPGDDADEVRFFDPAQLPEPAFESHRMLIDIYERIRSGQIR